MNIEDYIENDLLDKFEFYNVNAAAWCPAVDVANCPYVDGNGVHM